MNKLNSEEIQYFINNTIIPMLEPMKGCDIYATLLDIEGKIVFLTQKSLDSITPDFNPHLIFINTSYNLPPDNYIAELSKKYKLSEESIQKSCQKIYTLQMEAITNKKLITYIDLLPYKEQLHGYLTNLIPLFHPSGEVIALLMISNRYHLFGINELILLQTSSSELKNENTIRKTNDKVKLSKRQHEILFLLCNGLTQTHIAQVLNISRGTISKTIVSQINPKFHNPLNSEELIKRAKKLGFHNKMPQSLWNRYVIELN